MKQSGEQLQVMVVVKPETRVSFIMHLSPKQGPLVVSVQLSPITPVCGQLWHIMKGSGNRTFADGKQILLLFIRIHLLMRFQNYVALELIVSDSAITASG